jgi:4-hydroxybenzoate polyprenyltransferase
MAFALPPARALYGFSRGTQATLSVAQPVLAALIADSHPPLGRLTVCVLAAFAGYFAVFAVNDLLDARLDRRRFAHVREHQGFDIDSAGGRHPLAQGQLGFRLACAWVIVLISAALVLTALLNPVCLVLTIAAALLEIGYCALATVTAAKFLLAGAMVPLGAMVGWFAVRPGTDPLLLGLLFVWLAAWEIGGRNIVNDWADVEEDVHLGVRTVPVVYGTPASGLLVAGCVGVAFLAGVALMAAAWPAFGVVGVLGATAVGGYTLVLPTVRLLRDPSPASALVLFNRASLGPPAMLIVALAGSAA